MLLGFVTIAAAAPGVIAGATAPSFEILDGHATATLLLNPSTGSARAALDVLAFDAGATVPAHVHDASDELLYVVSGRVELTLAGRTLTAGPGDAILVPQGAEHAARALEAAKLVQVYVGAGPEDRFRAGTPRTP